jgi:tripartite-type tricarboxylate transporter receptor subunit TctC
MSPAVFSRQRGEIMKPKPFASAFALALAAAVACGSSIAQSYPSKPIRIVIGQGPGGGTDTLVRLIGRSLEKRLGQPVVIDNRPGGNSTLAGNAVVKAAPDSHTVFFGAAAAGMHPLFSKENAVDAAKDLQPVSNLIAVDYIYFVRSSLPIHSLKELLGYAKANPEKLNYGSPSVQGDLALAVLKAKTGFSYTIIPFSNDAQVITSLVGGQVDFSATGPAPYLAHVKSGSVRPIFTAAAKRSPVFPDLPTSDEQGVPGFHIGFNQGFWTTAGSPREAIQKLSQESASTVKLPELADVLMSMGARAVGSTPEEQMRQFEADVKFASEAVRLANYQPR